MKKLLLSTVMFMSFIILSAQHADIRAYGGLNLLQLTTDDGSSFIDGIVHDQSVSGRPGWQLGGSLTFGNHFFFQPGFQYGRVSTEIINTNDSLGTKYEDANKVSMISVPLKVGFRFLNPEEADLFNLRIYAGIYGHHITSVKHTTISGKIVEKSTSDYQNIIFNADFGAGVDFLFLFSDVGYQLGLSPVFQNESGSKANSFYATLGVKLDL